MQPETTRKCQKLPWSKIIKRFPSLTHLRMKFIMLINVEIPTNVGSLIFISMKDTTSETLKARKLKLFFSISAFMS